MPTAAIVFEMSIRPAAAMFQMAVAASSPDSVVATSPGRIPPTATFVITSSSATATRLIALQNTARRRSPASQTAAANRARPMKIVQVESARSWLTTFLIVLEVLPAGTITICLSAAGRLATTPGRPSCCESSAKEITET